MPSISIIIPVYNAKKYFSRCMDTLLNQSFKDFEIILVDDGSTDGSDKLCDDYQSRDDRIKVFHQKNSGVSAARNGGIDSANGKYVLFVDIDDYVAPGMFTKLYRQVENAPCDLLITGYYELVMLDDKLIKQSTRVTSVNTYTDINKFALNMSKLLSDKMIKTLWNKMYVMDIIRSNKIYFNSNMHCGGDFEFNLKYLDYCNRVVVSQDCFYYYIANNNNSITNCFDGSYWDTISYLYRQHMSKFMIEHQAYTEETKKIMESEFLNTVAYMAQSYVMMPISVRQSYHCVKNLSYDKSVVEAFTYGRISENKYYSAIIALLRYHLVLPVLALVKLKNMLKQTKPSLFYAMKR